MDNNQVKKIKKTIFQRLKKAEEKLENVSIIMERKSSDDALPILFKSVDIIVRLLLSFKQKPIQDYRSNIHALQEEYRNEGLFDQETLQLFHSLHNMQESYLKEIDFQCEEESIKKIFGKAENFLDKTYKFFNRELLTPQERRWRQRMKKILIIASAAVASGIIIFFLVRLGFHLFGPQHGLLARYFNNIQLKGPAVIEKIDKKINFKWGNMAPHPPLKNQYSVRWEGRIKIDSNDIYTFYIVSDEGVRLFIDDRLLINTWAHTNRSIEHSAKINLLPGFHKIKLEYYFNQKYADIRLLWSSRSFKKRQIDSSVLFPPLSYTSRR